MCVPPPPRNQLMFRMLPDVMKNFFFFLNFDLSAADEANRKARIDFFCFIKKKCEFRDFLLLPFCLLSCNSAQCRCCCLTVGFLNRSFYITVVVRWCSPLVPYSSAIIITPLALSKPFQNGIILRRRRRLSNQPKRNDEFF